MLMAVQMYDFGDMNGDGLMDMVGLGSQSLYVYTQNNITDFTETLIEDNLQSLATFDVMDADSDGDLDIVGGRTTVFDEHLILYRNNGAGSFVKESITNNGGSLVTAISHSDFNNDGLPDIIYGSDRDVAVMLSDGSNYDKITIGAITIGEGDVAKVNVADMDGDGRLDIVIARDYESRWYRNTSTSNSSISFEERPIDLSIEDDLVLGDLDNDGDIDMVATYSFMYLLENIIPQGT